MSEIILLQLGVETTEQACHKAGIPVQELPGGRRRRPISQVRATLARQVVEEQGATRAETARHFGVTTAAIGTALKQKLNSFKNVPLFFLVNTEKGIRRTQ